MNQLQMKVKRPVLYLVVPFLVHGLCAYLVQTVFCVAFLRGMTMPESLTYGSDEMMELVMKLAQKVSAYSTQITSATALVMLPILLSLYRRDWRKRVDSGIGQVPGVSAVRYALLIPLGIVVSIVSNNILNMSELALYSDTYEETSAALYTASLPVMLVGIGLIVPAAEEFMFRGLFYNRLRDMTSRTKAWIVSAILFGLYHGNLVQGIYGCLAGFLLVFVYERYGSMAAPILTHMAINITSVICTKTGFLDWMFADMKRLCGITVAGGLLLGICLMLLAGTRREGASDTVGTRRAIPGSDAF